MRNILRHLAESQDPQRKGQERPADRLYGWKDSDALTGAATRNAFRKRVDGMLAKEGAQGCLLILDVDRMQEINEKYGHAAGDRVLQSIAGMLRENFRGSDDIGRLEEDEFAIWLSGLSAERVGGIRRRVAVLNDRLMHLEDLPAVTLSAGVALGESGEDFKSLYGRAREVLRRVKERGRCGCEIYYGK